MARPGRAWLGGARHGKARRGKARQGEEIILTTHNTAWGTVGAIVRQAKVRADQHLDEKARRVPRYYSKGFMNHPKRAANYIATCDEAKRLGIKFAPRDKKFASLERRSRRKVTLATTETDVRNANRAKLKAALAARAAAQRKAAADAGTPRNAGHSDHRPDHISKWT
jgi:hypothetical protein